MLSNTRWIETKGRGTEIFKFLPSPSICVSTFDCLDIFESFTTKCDVSCLRHLLRTPDSGFELERAQRLKDNQGAQMESPHMVFHTITNVIWFWSKRKVRPKRKTPIPSENSSPPQHEAQVK